jgi:hypothetical protein
MSFSLRKSLRPSLLVLSVVCNKAGHGSQDDYLHSLVCQDTIASRRLEVVEQRTSVVDLDAAKDIFGPGNPAKVGRVAELKRQ